MLVDGGRFPSRLLTAIGDRLPFYDREIEVLAITHPDEWDIAAINSVLDRYTVGVGAVITVSPIVTEVFPGDSESNWTWQSIRATCSR